MEQLGLKCTNFYDTLIFCENLSRKFKFHEYLTRQTGTLHEDVNTFIIISRSVLPTMRNILEKVKKHLRSKTFFRKLCLFSDNLEKCGTARQATNDNKAQALCMLDN